MSSKAPGLILLIDDDPDCLHILSALLQRLWLDALILTTATLTEALRMLDQVTPDLVVADLALPDSKPAGTLTMLLTWLPQDVPLVIISGYVTPLEGQEMLTRGADAFLAKGIPPGEVQRTILHTWFRAQGRMIRQQLPERNAHNAPYDS